MIRWHRWFGLMLSDFFAGSAFEVELEAELSLKQQYLDILILRKNEGRVPEHLPDGLDNLASYNLLTYKSHQETLDAWALDELIGHYVNYRKQLRPSSQHLIPESDFQLYAVSTRTPRKLHQEFPLTKIQSGIWDLSWGKRKIRILVLSEMPESSHNALWEIFSHSASRVQQGLATYQWQLELSRGLFQQLTEHYHLEGGLMPYTIEDFAKEYIQEHIHVLSPEERLKNISPEECFKHFSPEEYLKRLSPEEIREYLKKQEN